MVKVGDILERWTKEDDGYANYVLITQIRPAVEAKFVSVVGNPVAWDQTYVDTVTKAELSYHLTNNGYTKSKVTRAQFNCLYNLYKE